MDVSGISELDKSLPVLTSTTRTRLPIHQSTPRKTGHDDSQHDELGPDTVNIPLNLDIRTVPDEEHGYDDSQPDELGPDTVIMPLHLDISEIRVSNLLTRERVQLRI